jgi:hypothetical protein
MFENLLRGEEMKRNKEKTVQLVPEDIPWRDFRRPLMLIRCRRNTQSSVKQPELSPGQQVNPNLPSPLLICAQPQTTAELRAHSPGCFCTPQPCGRRR